MQTFFRWFMLCGVILLTCVVTSHAYNYPFTDPYVATVINTPVGETAIELDVRDAMTVERLAAAVDRRAGKKGPVRGEFPVSILRSPLGSPSPECEPVGLDVVGPHSHGSVNALVCTQALVPVLPGGPARLPFPAREIGQHLGPLLG